MAAGAFARGAERQASGDWGGAFAGYDEAVKHEPNHPEFYLSRAYARHNTGDFDQALADYEKAIQLGPGLARIFHSAIRFEPIEALDRTNWDGSGTFFQNQPWPPLTWLGELRIPALLPIFGDTFSRLLRVGK